MNKIEEYLSGFDKKNTIKTKRMHLNNYFNFIGSKPNEYFDDGRDYEKDFLNYAQNMQGVTPWTRSARLNCVKLFFEENEINIPRKLWKKVSRKRPRAVTNDTIPTNAQLQRILAHGNTRDNALFLTLSSSGMRIDECLSLELEDIDLDQDPAKIRIRWENAKNDVPRTCYISSEAKMFVEEWLKERDDYLKQACKKGQHLNVKNPNDNTIFCFSYTNAWKIWDRLLRVSGYDQRDRSTKIHLMHIHTLRKFFETRMSYAGVPDAIYQCLEGHEGYLNGAYKRYTEQELSEWYKKGVQALLVFETQPDVSDIREQLKEVTHENKGYEDLIRQLKEQNERIERVSNHQFDRIRMLEYRIEDMSYQRALDQDQNATEEMKEKEYLKKFPTAKERKRDWDRLYNLMKADKNMTAEEKSRYWFLNDRIYWRLRNKEGIKKHWIDRLITPKGM